MTPQAYLSELFSLDGRVAMVTGGSSGIGRAIALALARAGASVLVVARREAELAATVGDLSAHGCRAAWVSADLSTRDGVGAAAEDAAEAFGEPDILVNCAGVNLRPPMGELSEDVWDTTMAVNLEAPYLLGQRFGPGMAERGFGRSSTSPPSRGIGPSSTAAPTASPRRRWSRWPVHRPKHGRGMASPATRSCRGS
jgi:NAD(P)-dependent dehydrogenase (short-subunit alcohol dehydrogenase family)